MIEASLELQKAIRSRLVSTPAVAALVPARSIFDRHTRPEKFPCIVIGEAQTILEPLTFARQHIRCFLDVHLWTDEDDLVGVKTIAGVVQKALAAKPAIDGLHVVDWMIRGVRFMRDPGSIGHAVITVEALVNEKVPA